MILKKIGQAFCVSVLGAAVLLGCNHTRRHCKTCECVCYPVCCEPALAAPVAKPQPVTPVVHKEEDNGDCIAVTVGAPADPSSRSEGVTGTMLLTAKQAERLGIKPGYTPSAMYMPGAQPVVAQPEAEKKEEATLEITPAYLPAQPAK